MGFMCYYGHVQNTSNLGEGNVYKSYFLGALVEIPCWSIPIIIAKLGRRWPLLFLFATSGVAGVVYGFIPVDYHLTSLSVGLIGRMTVNGAYFICLQYGSEIFPTVIRGQGIALCEIVGGIAIFLSPTVVYLVRVLRYQYSPVKFPLLPIRLTVSSLITFFLGKGFTNFATIDSRLLLAHWSFGYIFPSRNSWASSTTNTQGRRRVWFGSIKVGFCLHQEEQISHTRRQNVRRYTRRCLED